MADLTCHGCKHCLYSAPGGQAGDYPGRPEILSRPHSRCSALDVYVPMILGPRSPSCDGSPGPYGKWLSSAVPRECPEHRQPSLLAA
jgi:hypothetical protein